MGESSDEKTEARRAFLRNCAKFAAGAPPAITLLLAADQAAGGEDGPCPSFCILPGGECSDDGNCDDFEGLTAPNFNSPSGAVDPEVTNPEGGI